MIGKITRSVLAGAVLTAASFGAAPVARVIATEPIEIDGIQVPARNYSPVAIGDAVATKAGLATLQFRDGSNVIVKPNSRVKIEGKGAELRIRVVSGTAAYDLSPASRIRITDSKSETFSNFVNAAVPTVQALARPEAAAQALITGSAMNRQFGIMPASPIATGQFTTGVFHATGNGTATFTLPNGQVLNLSATTTVVNNKPVVTYTIVSVTVPVQTSSGASAGTVTVEPTSLVGATLDLNPSNNGNGNGNSGTTTVTIVSSSGQTLNPNTVATAINTSAEQAAPPNTTPVQTKPVKTGDFSPGS